MNISGLVAGEVNTALEQAMERRLREQMRQQQEQQAAAALEQRRVEEANQQARALRQFDLADLQRRDKNNDQGLALMQQDKAQLDEDTIVSGLSPTLKTIHGLSKIGVRGISPQDLQSPEDRAAAEQAASTAKFNDWKRQQDYNENLIRSRPREPKADNEPLVAIMGPDGVPTMVKRSDAVGKRPANTREQGRPVTSGDAADIADVNEALKLAASLDFKPSDTGIMPALGAMAPDAVTNLTGFGVGAKQRQGVINLVKQIIGKGLEGGVLRKEDEAKYEKMLPTMSDHPDVAKTKVGNMITTLQQKRDVRMSALEDAGYDVSKFNERSASVTETKEQRAARLLKQLTGGQ